MPFYYFEFDTSLSTQEVTERLRARIRKPHGFSESIRSSFSLGSFLPSKTLNQPLIGAINGDIFRVRREIHYRNSFLPLVRGRITPIARGSHISVKMFIHPLVAVFLLIWFGGIGSIGFLLLFKHQVAFAAFDFMPLGMFIFGVALTCGGFFPEVMKARRLIEETVKDLPSNSNQ